MKEDREGETIKLCLKHFRKDSRYDRKYGLTKSLPAHSVNVNFSVNNVSFTKIGFPYIIIC
jgi:hypothetical protein